MNSLRVLLSRLRALIFKRTLEQDLDDEIAAHIELQSEDLQRQGMSAEEARYAALKKFGGVDQIKETYRDRRSFPGFETLLRDLSYGLRMLRRSPGITLVAILSLALGIGANTALFSVVDATLIKTLPVDQPNQLALFEWQSGRAFRTGGMSGTSNVPKPPGMRAMSLFRYEVFARMRQQRSTVSESPLSDLFAFAPISDITAMVGDQPEVIDAQAVSGGYYAGLRVQPVLGRAITEEDDKPGAAPVVVLSHQFWQERFGADLHIVGRQLKLNKQSFTIIGVTSAAFTGTLQVDYHPAVTIPLALEPLVMGKDSRLGLWWLNLMGRLNPGATYGQAQQSLDGVFQATALELMPPPHKENQTASIDPQEYPHLIVESGSRGMLDHRRAFAPSIYGLFVIVALVLLIACANLANLLLARAALRGPEISVRLAVGASRWRLLRQLLTESLLLAMLGGVAGVLFAFWGKHALVALTDKETGLLPSGVELSLNWRILLFTLLVSLSTGVLFGLVPTWRATSLDLTSALKQSRRTASGVSQLGKSLIVVQVALSSLLLVGAGLFIRTLYNLQHVDVGFNQENLLVFKLQPRSSGYQDDQLVRFYQQLFSRLDHLPGVRAATFAKVALIANDNWFNDFLLPGEVLATAPEHETMRQMIRENYFTAMEIPFLRGREFTTQDFQHAPAVAIVNQTFQRNYFPNEDILGKHVTFTYDKRDVEIVGVVADAKYRLQREEIQPILYTPWQQEVKEIGEMSFALRTTNDPTNLASQVRQVVHELDSNLPVTEIGTQTSRAEATVGQERLYARLLSFFGVLALLLASIGLFGMLAYSVSQRTKEIGVRMAFGAQMANILRLVIWEGMKLVLLGLSLAALIGYAVKRLLERQYFGPDTWQHRMSEQLYGVKISDPLTLAIIATALMLVALLACWLPARRAAKVDPLVALRYE